MLGWRISAASFLFLAVAASQPARAQAQGRAGEPSSWGVRLFSEGGWTYYTRTIGKNAATIQGFASNQVIAELEDGPSVGGGVDIVLPDPSMHVRATFGTTVGAKAQAFLTVCGKEEFMGFAPCDTRVKVDARVVEGSVDLVFLQRRTERLLQPVLWLGAGLRSYHFDTDLPSCEQPDADAEEICGRGREIFEDPGVNPLLTFGVGLTTSPAPMSAFFQVRTVVTSYSGGVGLADGDMVVDVRLQGGVSVRVR